MTYRSYRRGERLSRAIDVIRGAKQAAAADNYSSYSTVDPRLEHRIDSRDDRAEERGYREQVAMARQLENAKDALAEARTAERLASNGDRREAKQALRDAERNLGNVEKAARKIGVR